LRETLAGIGVSWAWGDEIGLIVGKAARTTVEFGGELNERRVVGAGRL
jgi:hypothetical protein